MQNTCHEQLKPNATRNKAVTSRFLRIAGSSFHPKRHGIRASRGLQVDHNFRGKKVSKVTSPGPVLNPEPEALLYIIEYYMFYALFSTL